MAAYTLSPLQMQASDVAYTNWKGRVLDNVSTKIFVNLLNASYLVYSFCFIVCKPALNNHFENVIYESVFFLVIQEHW